MAKDFLVALDSKAFENGFRAHKKGLKRYYFTITCYFALMKVLGVIPARYESTRFPGKPLVNIQGKSMIARVYERCRQAKMLDEVIVATDS
ncbi:cytidylyltransferase domain-containing protein, partial [Okeania hirsuta]